MLAAFSPSVFSRPPMVRPGASAGTANALEAPGAGRRIGGGEHDEDARDPAVADPRFAAVEHVLIALPNGCGAQVRRIAARAGLGQRERADALAGNHLRHQRILGGIRAVSVDRPQRQAVVDMDRQRRACALGRQRLQQQGEGDDVKARAAVWLLRHDRAHEALARRPLEQSRRQRFLFISLLRDLRHLFGRKLPEHLLEHFLLGSQREVHSDSFRAGVRNQWTHLTPVS